MAGVAVQPGNANSTLPAIAGATGLMGALQGNHLAIVGALNGVIQTSPNLAQNSSHLPHPSAATSTSLPMSNCPSNSTARLFNDQHRQILLHQHQLQQLFSSQQATPEQQQALLYQLMQQQQNDIHLQQLPVNSLLPATQPAITTNPFLAMHNDSNAPKPGASAATIRQTKRLGEKAVSVTGQEKT